MKLRISSAEDIKTIQDYLGGLDSSKEYDITISVHKKKRSDEQNKRYWYLLGLISRETGNDTDTLHRFFARKFLGVDVYEAFGEKIGKVKSTRYLKVDAFAAYLTQIESFMVNDLDMVLIPEDNPISKLIIEE